MMDYLLEVIPDLVAFTSGLIAGYCYFYIKYKNKEDKLQKEESKEFGEEN